MTTATTLSSSLLRPRVLLVDDDEAHAAFVKALLRRAGWSLHLDVALDEATALEALEHHAFDAVLSDLHLNPGSGLRVLSHARTRQPAATRVLCTSAPETARLHLGVQALSAPLAHEVWDKAWDPAVLRKHFDRLLAHGFQPCPSPTDDANPIAATS